MPISDAQSNREYQREWERRKRLGLETKGIRKRKPAEPNTPEKIERVKKKANENYKKRRDIQKNKLNILIGSNCLFCKSERSLVAHEIYGNPHKGNGKDQYIDAFKRPNDFVRLCYSCHKGVHWAMKFMGMSWDEIKERATNKTKDMSI